jgi:hypothetical protein
MRNAEEWVKLPLAARRLGITTRQLLDRIDRNEIRWEFDREEGRFFIPADQLPA